MLVPFPSSRTYATRRPSGDTRGTGSVRSRLSSTRAAGGAALAPARSGAVPRGHSRASVRPGATRATWRPTRNGMSWADVASANRGTTESPTAPAR